MNRIVYYLSFFSAEVGFLFPDELPQNYYSPGLFLVESESNNNCANSYVFDAMDNGKRIDLKLIKANEGDAESALYMVKTEHYGIFWFNLERINTEFRYRGSHPQLKNHSDFFVAVTTDHEKLERVCQEFNFYFIGNTLRKSDL